MDKKKTFDFSGWATRNNVKCSDGRTIRKDAFKHNDGQTVPLVWNHNHQDADNVLGHALLENRNEGVYAYCSFNDTEQGRNAKELVKHGDICSLSIYANQLKQNGGDVIHGAIREVSLVLAGANPGAKIENVMVHSELDTFEAVLFNSSETFEFDVEKEVLKHTEQPEQPVQSNEEVKHAEEEIVESKEGEKKEMANNEKTVKEVFDSLTEEQKTVVYALIGAAVEDAKKEDNEEEGKEMKQNAFEGDLNNNENVISHSDIKATIEYAKKNGSMKEAFDELCLQHGITNIDTLFPEAQAISNMPATINDDTSWVSKVMAAVHHTPFSKVKMTAIDITGDEARARGYVKGNQKVEEVIAAMKRSTNPQTVYKLQKMDRDDIIDITDFDVVAYLKQEMRGKLDEEIARAILIGDGRSAASPDKINPLNIRPILGDDAVYTIAKFMKRAQDDTEYTFAKKFIKDVIRSRKDYKGSGNPTLFCTEDLLTDMLLIEDKNERVIYDTMDKLKTALRVKDIVTVPVMENKTRVVGDKTYKLMGILVNLSDYNVGADKGGQVNMFDDFDINYNKYEYLIETRCSGALVKPYSAISFEEDVTTTPAVQE